MSYQVLCLILSTILLSACAQLALKLGVSKQASTLQTGVFDVLVAAAVSPFIWLGLIIYGLSVAIWLYVLSKVDLSVAYPFVGVSFLVTMDFSGYHSTGEKCGLGKRKPIQRDR